MLVDDMNLFTYTKTKHYRPLKSFPTSTFDFSVCRDPLADTAPQNTVLFYIDEKQSYSNQFRLLSKLKMLNSYWSTEKTQGFMLSFSLPFRHTSNTYRIRHGMIVTFAICARLDGTVKSPFADQINHQQACCHCQIL